MEHFNKLSPPEDERLALLAEECGELIQAIGKIQRHGYESYNPDNPKHLGNRVDLQKECGHVLSAMQLMMSAADVSMVRVYQERNRKTANLNLYLHHNHVR